METEEMIETNLHIRWIIRRDLEDVLKIENECFEHPWSESDFHNTLRQRNFIGMAIEACEVVVGYMVYEISGDGIAVVNFAVRPDCQRRKIGSAMVGKLKSKLSPERRRRLVLDIRETNLAAQQFFRSHGFKAVRVLRKYEITGEDAYRFQFGVGECSGKK